MDEIAESYKNLKEMKARLRAESRKRIQEDMKPFRDEFEELVYRTVRIEGSRISAVAREMGVIGTAGIHDILNRREAKNWSE